MKKFIFTILIIFLLCVIPTTKTLAEDLTANINIKSSSSEIYAGFDVSLGFDDNQPQKNANITIVLYDLQGKEIKKETKNLKNDNSHQIDGISFENLKASTGYKVESYINKQIFNQSKTTVIWETFYLEPRKTIVSTQAERVGGNLVDTNVVLSTKKDTGDVIDVEPQETGKDIEYESTYMPLAPLTEDQKNKGIETTNIGAYFNTIFNIALGLAAALAIIMIIIGGVQWMGTDSIFGKTEAKKQITSAILGLLIALGSFALLNTINPALRGRDGLKIKGVSIKLDPLYDRGANDPKQANGESVRCTPVTSGPCSVSNLTKYFPNDAVAMSKICNMESGGNSIPSGTDVCKPGDTAFSFGLFQVNLAANGILAGKDCAGLFDKQVSAKDVIEPRYTSGYSCKLLTGKETLYNTCKNILLDTTKNLEIAKSLYTKDKKAWIGDKKYCASAFN